LIAQRVDVIGVAPLTETGWDEVFKEAKDAGIPIILVDRRADVPEDLYATLMGSDFLEAGRNAARIMTKLTDGRASIVELVGTIDSAPANDRYKGFREILPDYPGMKIIDSRSGDFTIAQGREVMESFLKTHGRTITALYAHNDDMALGAIKAIEAYGLRPGVDIKIVSVDAARGAFEAMIAGTLNATVECNPLLGPKFLELALKVANGETVPKWVPSVEGRASACSAGTAPSSPASPTSFIASRRLISVDIAPLSPRARQIAGRRSASDVTRGPQWSHRATSRRRRKALACSPVA
jgi:simple sugar transport system substrate-binding protein